MASTAGVGLICECEYCEEFQTSIKAANYGMCDGHYKGSLQECERCGAQEFHWCNHKEKAEG